MKTPEVRYPVTFLDGRVLIPSGTRLTPSVLKEVIASNNLRPHRKYDFLNHRTLGRDIGRLFQETPYSSIFMEKEKTFALSLMKHIRLAGPFLDIIDHFHDRDPYTYRHILMVFALSSILVRDLITESADWIREAMAGTLHDLGKVCVPLSVLKKNSPISRTERDMLEHHALAGYVLVSHVLGDPASFAARVARGHHERKDGSGYPSGILLRDRMVEIIAACDVYDALLSPRPYRPKPYDNRTALETLTDMAQNRKFSWKVVKALVAHNRKDRPPVDRCRISLEKRGTPPSQSLYGKIVDEDR